MSKAVELSSLLIGLEAQMRQLALWQSEPPSDQLLASVEPFCVDTLTFPQWLQFVFLTRMYAILSAQQVLPSSCSIAPMATEYFKTSGDNAEALIVILEAIDRLLSS